MAKDKRQKRSMSHGGFQRNFNDATRGWDRKKRRAFHDYLAKEYPHEKNQWEKRELMNKASSWETWHWFG
jgi:hypothetical protein